MVTGIHRVSFAYPRLVGRPDEGATAVEYALLAAAVAAVIVAIVYVIGQKTGSLFQCTDDAFATYGATDC
jgi:pilus assembly protein Flp/PilA